MCIRDSCRPPGSHAVSFYQTATSHRPSTRAKPIGRFCGTAPDFAGSMTSCVMQVTPGPMPPGEQSPSFSVARSREVPVKRRCRLTTAVASSSLGCATPPATAGDTAIGEITGRRANPAPKPTARHPAAMTPIALPFMPPAFLASAASSPKETPQLIFPTENSVPSLPPEAGSMGRAPTAPE